MPADNENDRYGFHSSDDETASDDEHVGSLHPAAEALLDRLTALLDEVEAFQKSLRRNLVEKSVELRLFLGQVKAEMRCIQGASPRAPLFLLLLKLAGVLVLTLCKQAALESPDNPKARHTVCSTNEPWLAAVWRAAKSTTGITALFKTFMIVNDGVRGNDGKRAKRTKTSVTVDVVAQNGLQWSVFTYQTHQQLSDT